MHKMIAAKRAFDLVISSLGLIAAAPLMCVIAVLIKLESRGPVFYSCTRAGKGHKLFGMLKFRTMVENADNIDCTLCSANDIRVTRFGRLLRRSKLNELPQLFNVIAGQMSMVGPRPEHPKFLKYYPDKWQIVLSVRPGVVGINQIINRNEEDRFPVSVEPEGFYIESILPDKLERDVAYVSHWSLFGDFILLCRAAYHTLFKGFSVRRVLSRQRILQLALLDVLCSLFAYTAANLVRFETLPVEDYIWKHFAIIALANPLAFYAMGVYRSSIRFFSLPDFLLLIRASCVAGIVLVCVSYFLMFGAGHSRAVFAVYPVFLLLGISGARIGARLLRETRELRVGSTDQKVRVIIYGAGRLGTEIVRRIHFQPEIEVVGFVDDNEDIRGQTVLGVSVLGSGLDLPFIKSLFNVGQVIIAFDSSRQGIAEAGRQCLAAGLEYAIAPSIKWSLAAPSCNQPHCLYDFVDTLGITPITLNSAAITPLVEGATIAVVGAGDALGEALCLELAKLGTNRLVLVEDCDARLARIGRLASDVEGSGVSFLPYLVPLASPGEWIEEILVSNAVTWIIYNRPNRPSAQTALNTSRTFELQLRDASLFLELAGKCGCRGFSFLSPCGKDCFSYDDKEFFLLMEKFLRVSANTAPRSLRSSIIRLSNILQNECELLATASNRMSQGRPVQAHVLPLAFTSAENAARAFLNTMPAHHRGETFEVMPDLEAPLRSMIERFLKFQGDGHAVADLMRPIQGDEPKLVANRSVSIEAFTAKAWPDFSMVADGSVEDIDLLYQRLEQFINPRRPNMRWTTDWPSQPNNSNLS
jgi:lipopolysaccharide/colanic/teichoic acid biosynthesis glycosyltransferase